MCEVIVIFVIVIVCLLAMTELRTILGSSIIISVFTCQSHCKKYNDRIYSEFHKIDMMIYRVTSTVTSHHMTHVTGQWSVILVHFVYLP